MLNEAFRLTAMVLSLWALFLSPIANAEELIPLTDKSGRTIQAKIILVVGEEVEIETANGARHTLPISKFSLSTQELIKSRSATPATPAASADAPPAISPTEFVNDPIFAFTSHEFKVKQLDHFRIHTLKTSADPADKYAEKIYAEMVKTMPALPALFENQGFRAPGKPPNANDFTDPDKRFRHDIYLVEEQTPYEAMVGQFAATLPQEEQRQKFTLSSGTVGNFVDFDHRMSVIRKEDGKSAEQLLAHILGFQLLGATVEQRNIPFWLRMGAGYYAEHSMFKKCTVQYVNFDNYYQSEGDGADGNKMTKSETLSNSEPWIKPLKELCKNEKRVTLARLCTVTTADLTPNDSAYAMALFIFMNSTPEKTTSFNNLLKLIKEGKTPDPQVIAETFGFASPEEFELAWFTFIMSSDFR